MEKYECVPDNIITGKDLDYLCDMFNWNYNALKCINNNLCCINNDKINEVFNDSFELFLSNLNLVLDIIDNPGGEIDE
jgi:hypothetical protein